MTFGIKIQKKVLDLYIFKNKGKERERILLQNIFLHYEKKKLYNYKKKVIKLSELSKLVDNFENTIHRLILRSNIPSCLLIIPVSFSFVSKSHFARASNTCSYIFGLFSNISI